MSRHPPASHPRTLELAKRLRLGEVDRSGAFSCDSGVAQRVPDEPSTSRQRQLETSHGRWLQPQKRSLRLAGTRSARRATWSWVLERYFLVPQHLRSLTTRTSILVSASWVTMRVHLVGGAQWLTLPSCPSPQQPERVVSTIGPGEQLTSYEPPRVLTTRPCQRTSPAPTRPSRSRHVQRSRSDSSHASSRS